MSLCKWFEAISFITSDISNSNSVKLSKHIQITQKTAWGMIQKMKIQDVINNNISSKIKKDNDKEDIKLIRNAILNSRITIPGTKSIRFYIFNQIITSI